MFKITEDYLMEWDLHAPHSNQSLVGTIGEETASTPFFPAQPLPIYDHDGMRLEMVKFRLYDDDGYLYFEGECHDDVECENQSTALLWGEQEAGCTVIKVLRNMEWIQEIA